MIEFELLDKNKTYLGVQYGEGFISKKIRKYSKMYAPNSKQIPTHVLALVYENDSWYIYESHARGFKDLAIAAGVRRFTAEKWKIAESEAQEQFFAYELVIDKKTLKKHLGEPYSLGDIRSLFFAALLHRNGKQKDREGLICSEYMALCYPDICETYALPAWCITPAHFQDYFDNKGQEYIKNINIEEAKC